MNLSYNNQDTEVKLFNFETNNNNQLMKVLAIITREPQLFDAKERLRLPEENETLKEVTMLLPVDLWVLGKQKK